MKTTATERADGKEGAGGNGDPELALVRAFLRERGGAASAGVQVVPLSGDASTRRYFRLVDKDRTLVLALYPEPFRSEDLTFLGVRTLLHGFGVPVPGWSMTTTPGNRGPGGSGDLTLRKSEDGRRRPADAPIASRSTRLAVLHRESTRGAHRAPCTDRLRHPELSWDLHYFKHFWEGSGK